MRLIHVLRVWVIPRFLTLLLLVTQKYAPVTITSFQKGAEQQDNAIARAVQRQTVWTEPTTLGTLRKWENAYCSKRSYKPPEAVDV